MRGLSEKYWEDYCNDNLEAPYISKLNFKNPNLSLSEEQIDKYVSVNNNFFASVGAGGFVFGDLITDTFQVELINGDTYWDYVKLSKNTIVEVGVSCRRANDGSIACYIDFGSFKVAEINKTEGYVTLSLTKARTDWQAPAWKRFSRNTATQETKIPYSPYDTFVDEVSKFTGLGIKKAEVDKGVTLVGLIQDDSMPAMTSVAELLKAIAVFSQGYARIYGFNQVEMVSINEDLKYVQQYLYHGGIFDELSESKYVSGDALNGGDFKNYGEPPFIDTYDKFMYAKKIHYIHYGQISNLQKEENVKIDGLKGQFFTCEYDGTVGSGEFPVLKKKKTTLNLEVEKMFLNCHTQVVIYY